MSKKTIAVIFGGFSSEYNVSLQSAYSVINAIDEEKYTVILLGITRQGQWFRYTGDTSKIPDDTWCTDTSKLIEAEISPSRGKGLLEFYGSEIRTHRLDAVFPILHGKCGEDGTVQGLCELAGIPVVGCQSAASALCMDKDRAHKLVALTGIRVPKALTYKRKPTGYEIIIKELGLPLFVKPVKAGSSYGISMVQNADELSEAFDTAFLYDDMVTVEERINGFETGCAVLGNEELTTGRADEIELSHGFFDFIEKYSLKTSKIHMPARVSDETEKRICQTAKRIYKTLGCEGFARVDMFLTPEGEIVFNEVNTIPGFTAHSRYPNMMRGVGIGFEELVNKMIELGLERVTGTRDADEK